VAVDVLFDHYLIRHWQRFSNQSFISYKSKVYELIEQGYPLMPVAMQQSMTSLVNNDWFESYGSLQGTGFAIDRIAQRIRFENQFAGCIDDIIQQDQHLEQLFLDFFPQLQQFASEY
jgi:acyl carrier protein phosphodiesterase